MSKKSTTLTIDNVTHGDFETWLVDYIEVSGWAIHFGPDGGGGHLSVWLTPPGKPAGSFFMKFDFEDPFEAGPYSVTARCGGPEEGIELFDNLVAAAQREWGVFVQKKGKRGDRSRADKIRTRLEWDALDKDEHPTTLENWLLEKFGTHPNGDLIVPPSTFYSWPKS